MVKMSRNGKDVEVYKNLIDFSDSYVNNNFNYELIGFNKEVKKGDKMYVDLARDLDRHTLIYAEVLKVLKSKIVVKFVYC